MISALPARVMNYRVSAASPTAELITVGQILSEVGDYASTILDREHLSFTRKCAARLRKVVAELIARHCIGAPQDLYETEKCDLHPADLSAMTISQLHSLYRQWPARHEMRLREGREHMTFYYEAKIIRELQHRKPATKDEQLKIDYSLATYRNELENLSRIYSLPVTDGEYKAYPDAHKRYTPSELASLISRFSGYRDILGRERLIEYVDRAIDIIDAHPQEPQVINLAARLVELSRRGLIKSPDRIERCLLEAVETWKKIRPLTKPSW